MPKRGGLESPPYELWAQIAILLWPTVRQNTQRIPDFTHHGEGLPVSVGLAKDWLVYVIVRLLICIVQALPIETCARLARPLAYLFGDVLRIRRKTVAENLSRALPDLTDQQREQVARGMWEHLLLLICEIAHLPRKVHETNWRDYIHLGDIRSQVAALLSTRPCVILSAHFGNFEAGGYMTGMFGFRTHTIARPLDNRFLNRWLNGFRQSNGQTIMPRRGAASHAAVLLQQGGNLVLLGDQFGGHNGCWIEFFGRPASYHKAIALFCVTSGAPMVVSYARRRGQQPLQIELEVEGTYDPLENNHELGGVREVTQWYNDLLEQMIRRHPDQYWWLHRRWKGDPKMPKRKRKQLPRAA